MKKILGKLIVSKDTGRIFYDCKRIVKNPYIKGHLTRSDVLILKGKTEDERMIAFPTSLELYPIIVSRNLAKRFTDIFINRSTKDSFEISIISREKH
ncbi:MAG: hypothetical protein PWQ60_438 [Thermoanaerobacteraceae bacterium]|nr:hypothetical protein [Thermoanaerobacteraceae bacterium]